MIILPEPHKAVRYRVCPCQSRQAAHPATLLPESFASHSTKAKIHE